jgi:hypothetical protein
VTPQRQSDSGCQSDAGIVTSSAGQHSDCRCRAHPKKCRFWFVGQRPGPSSSEGGGQRARGPWRARRQAPHLKVATVCSAGTCTTIRSGPQCRRTLVKAPPSSFDLARFVRAGVKARKGAAQPVWLLALVRARRLARRAMRLCEMSCENDGGHKHAEADRNPFQHHVGTLGRERPQDGEANN